ncbi:MAG: BamA/TamA family outer membrane protein [bacterium]
MGPCFPWRSAFVALVVTASLVPPPALADAWTKERPADISRFGLSSVLFEGDLPVPVDQLRSVMRSSSSGLLRFRAVDPDRLEGDAQRIRAQLRRLGYWRATVELELLFDPPRRDTRAVFHVTPGAQRRVGRITASGDSVIAEPEILSWIQQKTGEPFDIAKTDRDRLVIENTYANRGFYDVQVTADIRPAAGDSSSSASAPIVHDLVYRVTEGPRYMVGNIRIEGNEFTKGEIIRRELALQPGDVLSRVKVDDSRAQLYSTGYFAAVTIVPETGSSPDAVNVVVRVTERQMRYVSAGLGYGTLDQLRISGEWGHRNLWGRGKRATVSGVLATHLFPADLVRTTVEGRYVEPWLFNTRTTGTVQLSYEKGQQFFNVGTQQYQLRVVTLLTNVSRQLARHTRGWATLENEWAKIDLAPGQEPPDAADRPDQTRTLSLTLERDRRNDYFDPTRGFLNRVIGSVSGGVLGGDNNFWRLQGEPQWFRQAKGLTLAGRLRVGYERPFGSSEFVTDRLRFKLGGPTTVRGYGYQEIGPGDFLILGNFELRFPLFWKLSGGLFLDGGNAWPDVSDVSWKDFRPFGTKDDPDRAKATEVRYGLGGGLRFATPVGPVRFDVARKTKMLPVAPGTTSAERRWAYDFSLGHAF